MRRLCIFVIFNLSIIVSIRSNDPIKVVYFNSFAPFSYEENGAMKGILIDALDEAIAKRLGVPITHSGYPWVRAQEMVRNGEADAYVTIPTKERLMYTYASEKSVISSRMTLFTFKKSPLLDKLRNVKTVSELNDFRIGVYLGHGWAKQHLEGNGIHVYWAPNIDNVFLMLMNDRIDATVEIEAVMLYMIKKAGYQNDIIEVPVKLDMSSWHLCVGKTSRFKDIIPKFDKVLEEMRRDGTLEAIYKKYR